MVLRPDYDWISKDAVRVSGCDHQSVTIAVTSLNGVEVISVGGGVEHRPRGSSVTLSRGDAIRFPGGPPHVEVQVV